MAKGGHVYHWKHGWIPLDRAAYLNKMGKGPKPTGPAKGGSLTKAERIKIVNMMRKQRGDAPIVPKAQRSASPKVTFTTVDAPSTAASSRADRYRKLDVVDGVDFVTYRSPEMDPLGTDHGTPHEFTPEQRKVLAKAYNDVKSNFPGMQPVQIVGVNNGEAFGITSWDGRRISIAGNVFDPVKGRTLAAHNFGKHGAMAGQHVGSTADFAHAVMVHEMGHALQMQNATASRRGTAMATERVTATDLGVLPPGEVDTGATIQRWQMDTLGHQSAYATANQYEWFAEAFADGYLNGKKATPQGKAAVEMLHGIYGKG